MSLPLLSLTLLAGMQEPPPDVPQGQLMYTAAAVRLDGPTANENQRLQIPLHKRYGSNDETPTAFIKDGRPDFTATGHPAGAYFQLVDAESTGENWIPAYDNGAVSLSAQLDSWGWGGLTLSLAPGAQGAPGSQMEAILNSGNTGAELLFYNFPDSDLPSNLVGQPLLAWGPGDVEIATTPPANVTSVDLFLPILFGEPNVFAFPVAHFDNFFFSLDGSVTTKPAGWANPQSRAITGATIYRATWSAGSWSVMVWLDHNELGVDPAADMDALAVDEQHEFIVYSLKGSNEDPILFHNLDWGNRESPTALTEALPGGLPGPNISTQMGLRLTGQQIDDPDAICVYDPRRDGFPAFWGRTLPGPVTSMSASVSRGDHVLWVDTTDQATSWVTNVPIGPGGTNLTLTTVDSYGVSMSYPYAGVGSTSFKSAPITMPGWSGGSAWVDFQWTAVDAVTGAFLGTSEIVRIQT